MARLICHTLSHAILYWFILSHPVLPCPILSCNIKAYLVHSWYIMSYLLSHVIPILSYSSLYCHGFLSYLVLSRLILFILGISCLIIYLMLSLFGPFLPSTVMAYPILSYLIITWCYLFYLIHYIIVCFCSEQLHPPTALSHFVISYLAIIMSNCTYFSVIYSSVLSNLTSYLSYLICYLLHV